MRSDKMATDAGRPRWLRGLEKPAVSALIIVVIGLLSYANSFHVPFIFDDESSIKDNAVIKSLANFYSNSSGYDYNPRRFIGYLSFALNYHFGGLAVTGYHAVNLAVHLANSLLVYALAAVTLRTPYFSLLHGGDRSREPVAGLLAWLPLLAALLFVSHPVQTQAVTYIVQRLTSLAALFYLLALLLYARMRSGVVPGAPVKPRVVPLYLLSLTAALLAMKSKEIAFTLPLVVVLYEFSFFRGTLRSRVALLFPMLATLLVIPLSMLNAGKAGELLSDVSKVTSVQTDLSRWDYLMTQFSVITTYLRLLFLPVNQNLDYDYPVYSSLLEPRVLFCFLFLAALVALAAYLYRRSQQGTGSLSYGCSRLAGFGILWFFLTLAVESSLIPIVDVIFEHRLYLPSVGAFVAIGAGALLFTGTLLPEGGRRLAPFAAAAVIAALSLATFQRNHDWRDAVLFWEDCLSKSPGKARISYNLGTELVARGRVDEAIGYFERAIAQRPTSQAYNNLGSAYKSKGRTGEAIVLFQRAISMQPDNAEAYHNLAAAYLAGEGRSGEAIDLLLTALRLKPDYDDAQVNLAAAYIKGQRYGEAVSQLSGRDDLLRERSDARFNLAVAYHCMGQTGPASLQLAALRVVDARYASQLEQFMSRPFQASGR